MIDPAHVQMMVRYNAWQNNSVYSAADTLSQEARLQDRGAFFKSIQGTLSHIYWGDRMWMSRFAGLPKPDAAIEESPEFVEDWAVLKAERVAFDQVIQAWAMDVEPDWLVGSMTYYSAAIGKEKTADHALLVTHFFNHQTHHRGQVHAMLTAAGARLDDTDLVFMSSSP